MVRDFEIERGATARHLFRVRELVVDVNRVLEIGIRERIGPSEDGRIPVDIELCRSFSAYWRSEVRLGVEEGYLRGNRKCSLVEKLITRQELRGEWGSPISRKQTGVVYKRI